MKGLIKKLFSLSLVVFTLMIVQGAWAVVPINFIGPKITDYDIPHNLPVIRPEIFAAYEFICLPNRTDLAVPELGYVYQPTATTATYFSSFIMGLDNKDVFNLLGPNVFFNHDYVGTYPVVAQVIAGEFNGNATKDLVVVRYNETPAYGDIIICFDYAGGNTCPGGFSPPYELKDSLGADAHPVIAWEANVADYDGDGDDDVAVIGYSPSMKGYLYRFHSNNTGPNPLTQVSIKETPGGIPTSIASGRFDANTNIDVMVGLVPLAGPSAILQFFSNNGADFNAAINALTVADCYFPTNLTSKNPNGDLLDDLYLTCAIKTLSPLQSGPVVIIKNDGAPALSIQQTITGFNLPYSTAVGDLNGDGASKPDLVVAEYKGFITTFAGSGPFAVDVATRNQIFANKKTPKWVQLHDMNGDGLLDIVATASTLRRPKFSKYYYEMPAEIIPLEKAKSFPLEFVGDFSDNKAIFMSFEEVNKFAKANATPVVDFNNFEDGRYLEMVNPNTIRGKFIVGRVSPLKKLVLVKDGQDERYMTINSGIPVGSLEDLQRSSLRQGAVSSLSRPDSKRNTHGVLVLLNFRPNVNLDDPKCDTSKVTAHCQPSPSKTIVDCKFETSESWGASANPTQTVNGSGRDVTFDLPQAEGTYNFTITAAESGGNTYTGTFTVDYVPCPAAGGSPCPAEPLKVEVWVDDPFSLTIPAPMAQALASPNRSVIWQGSGGLDLFGISDASIFREIVVDGTSLRGRFNWPETDRTVNLSYTIHDNTTNADVVANCPALLVNKAALMEGSGCGRCNLGTGLYASPSLLAMLFSSLLATPLVGFYLLRRRVRRK